MSGLKIGNSIFDIADGINPTLSSYHWRQSWYKIRFKGIVTIGHWVKTPMAKALKNADNWKRFAVWNEDGYYDLRTEDTGTVPVRLFLSTPLLTALEDLIYRQIINATSFPGTKAVMITPDVHYGYGVPVGCVLVTDRKNGAIAMGPVGYDIGCGMMSARSNVDAEEATPEKRMAFNREVMARVAMGAGSKSTKLGALSEAAFQKIIRGGAEYYCTKYGATFDRSKAERQRIPVADSWKVPWGGKGRPERGLGQLGTLGGGNHFIELQKETNQGTLFVQVHTGSRGFGHGLATNYFELAREERPEEIVDIDLGYFVPDSRHYDDYLNAVSAGGNYAIVNRLVIFEQVAAAFRQVFGAELELLYEISHNLVQHEIHPEYGDVWVHRKGATRAFPAKHPALSGTPWESTGHPVLIPGSNKSHSYVLYPLAGAVKSCFSVNHGAGRRLSRAQAAREFPQEKIDEEYRKAGILVNLDGHVPIDEAEHAYKSPEEVVNVVVAADLARIEHRLWPLSSLNGTEEGGFRRKRSKK